MNSDSNGWARLTIAYALFAGAAMLVNIGSQMLANAAYSGFLAVPISMIVGTAAGLLAKYWLDKRYIFRVRTRSLAHDGRLFVLYAAMGLATTAIFWATEYGFDRFFRTEAMRYLGAVIGLGVGYCTKYWLDRRFVFEGLLET
jgi:hypothetical protein